MSLPATPSLHFRVPADVFRCLNSSATPPDIAQLLTSPPSTAPNLSQPHLDYSVTPAALVGGIAADQGPRDRAEPRLWFRHHGLRRRGGEAHQRSQRRGHRRPHADRQNRRQQVMNRLGNRQLIPIGKYRFGWISEKSCVLDRQLT